MRKLLAFIHVAKTGGQTVETMLRSTFGARYCHAELWQDRLPTGDAGGSFKVPKYDNSDFRRLKLLCPWMRCVGGHAVALWSGIDRVQPTNYFAFLRDPLTRGASHFQFHQRTESNPLSWDEWVQWKVHHNHQVKMFSQDCNVDQAIEAIEKHRVFLGLMEHFDESLILLQRLMAPELNLGYSRTNTAGDRSIAGKLLADPVKRDQLAEMYKLDQILYDHVKNNVFPRFQNEYGTGLTESVAGFKAGHGSGFSRVNAQTNRVVRRLWLEPWGAHFRKRARSTS
ncbi:MAG: hypothetical protein KOO60_08500 [Gemmatimonadales bacterium]|nr:hypothetical protein [Gemmatimonadales bacterium]